MPRCPDFGRSINPTSTRRGRLSPPFYYWHFRIFRPSYGPEDYYIAVLALAEVSTNSVFTIFKFQTDCVLMEKLNKYANKIGLVG